MAFEQGASDLTADFLQREKQAAGVLLGDDEAPVSYTHLTLPTTA